MLSRLARSAQKTSSSMWYLSRGFSTVPKWATVDPFTMSGSKPGKLQNYVNGKWKDSKDHVKVIDPMNGEHILEVPNTQRDAELQEFIDAAASCPKSGLHNPLKNPERYNLYGQVMHRAAAALEDKEINAYFAKCIQRVMPKSDVQSKAEVDVTKVFLQNFAGDNCRFLARSFMVAGDHNGQFSTGNRWPYGPVCIVAPFNFPLEIPVLQMVGALITGNRVTVKGDVKVSLLVEQFARLLLDCGAPPTDFDVIHTDGKSMEKVITKAPFRMTQFTGSSTVANHLATVLKGKIRIEDAGFDWKLLGPDVHDLEYVAWQCDQDAFAASGQKCSAQSILVAHENWMKAGFIDKVAELASRRKVDNLTLGPILTWNNKKIQKHIEKVLSINGAKLLFGGKPLTGHKIPEVYGAFQPTAVYVPLKELIKKENFHFACEELFGPFYVVTSWSGDGDLETVLKVFEKMDHHLTAAVVSRDPQFQNKVLANTVNGTTYSGIRARTTGAPQNHWFGPSGDPRGAGIGSPEAILSVWTAHREIIYDQGPIPKNWKLPPPS